MSVDLPPEAWAAALAGLPLMGPSRLLTLLRRWPPPVAWQRVAERAWVRDPSCAKAGGASLLALANEWSHAAERVDVAVVWQQHLDAGIGVAALGSNAYPAPLTIDIEPPGVIFTRGDPNAIAGPRVAIVGTRAATRYGLDVAFELGHDLSCAGVAVVSGLAVGIDAAAHAGALAAGTAPPIGVVGSGSTSCTRGATHHCGAKSSAAACCSVRPRSGPGPSAGGSPLATASSPPSPTWSSSSSHERRADRCTRSPRRNAAIVLCSPPRGRCAARPRRAPTGSSAKEHMSRATPVTSSWRWACRRRCLDRSTMRVPRPRPTMRPCWKPSAGRRHRSTGWPHVSRRRWVRLPVAASPV